MTGWLQQGAGLLLQTIRAIADGTAGREKQDHSQATMRRF